MAISATPWVERYRPKDLTDVSHQTEVISTLKNAVETNRLPHLLFYGAPGKFVFLLNTTHDMTQCFCLRSILAQDRTTIDSTALRYLYRVTYNVNNQYYRYGKNLSRIGPLP